MNDVLDDNDGLSEIKETIELAKHLNSVTYFKDGKSYELLLDKDRDNLYLGFTDHIFEEDGILFYDNLDGSLEYLCEFQINIIELLEFKVNGFNRDKINDYFSNDIVYISQFKPEDFEKFNELYDKHLCNLEVPGSSEFGHYGKFSDEEIYCDIFNGNQNDIQLAAFACKLRDTVFDKAIQMDFDDSSKFLEYKKALFASALVEEYPNLIPVHISFANYHKEGKSYSMMCSGNDMCLGSDENVRRINGVNFYDNSDGSLEIISSADKKLYDIVVAKSYGFSFSELGTEAHFDMTSYTSAEFKKFNELYDNHLCKLAPARNYKDCDGDFGKFKDNEIHYLENLETKSPSYKTASLRCFNEGVYATDKDIAVKLLKDGMSKSQAVKCIYKNMDKKIYTVALGAVVQAMKNPEIKKIMAKENSR